MKSTVSIIIIAHRNDFTLKDALYSIEKNSRPHDQKILVLNFPSAEVEAIAKTLSGSWEVVYEMNGRGPQHARNKGASVARGEFLVFLDDDVELAPGWIDHMLSRFTSPYVALGQGYLQLEKTKSFIQNYYRYKTISYFSKLRNKTIIGCDTGAIIVKKNWFEAVKGFSPELNYGEDTYFGQKLSIHGGQMFMEMNRSLRQIYNPQEKFFDHFAKIKDIAPYQVQLMKKTHATNIIDFLGKTFRNQLKGFKRPLSYLLINLCFKVYYEVTLNPYRHELMPAGTEKKILRKRRLLTSP